MAEVEDEEVCVGEAAEVVEVSTALPAPARGKKCSTCRLSLKPGEESITVGRYEHHKQCVLADRAMQRMAESLESSCPGIAEAMKSLKKKNNPKYIEMVLSQTTTPGVRRGAEERHKCANMLEEIWVFSRTYKERATVMLGQKAFVQWFMRTEGMTKEEAEQKWSDDLGNADIKREVEDGRTVLAVREPTRYVGQQGLESRRGIRRQDELDTEEEVTAALGRLRSPSLGDSLFTAYGGTMLQEQGAARATGETSLAANDGVRKAALDMLFSAAHMSSTGRPPETPCPTPARSEHAGCPQPVAEGDGPRCGQKRSLFHRKKEAMAELAGAIGMLVGDSKKDKMVAKAESLLSDLEQIEDYQQELQDLKASDVIQGFQANLKSFDEANKLLKGAMHQNFDQRFECARDLAAKLLQERNAVESLVATLTEMAGQRKRQKKSAAMSLRYSAKKHGAIFGNGGFPCHLRDYLGKISLETEQRQQEGKSLYCMGSLGEDHLDPSEWKFECPAVYQKTHTNEPMKAFAAAFDCFEDIVKEKVVSLKKHLSQKGVSGNFLQISVAADAETETKVREHMESVDGVQFLCEASPFILTMSKGAARFNHWTWPLAGFGAAVRVLEGM